MWPRSRARRTWTGPTLSYNCSWEIQRIKKWGSCKRWGCLVQKKMKKNEICIGNKSKHFHPRCFAIEYCKDQGVGFTANDIDGSQSLSDIQYSKLEIDLEEYYRYYGVKMQLSSSIESLTVKELKQELSDRNLDRRGKKADLQETLRNFMELPIVLRYRANVLSVGYTKEAQKEHDLNIPIYLTQIIEKYIHSS